MAISIPWVSYKKEMGLYKKFLNQEGYVVEELQGSDEALPHLERFAYPLVLIQDWPPLITRQRFPASVENKPEEITCYLIREIRRIPAYERTPILVPHIGLRKEREKYIKAGATQLVDLFNSFKPVKNLVNAVKLNLQKV